MGPSLEALARASVQHGGVDRKLLRCAASHCYFLVHESPEFGGFCCKKCHWIVSTGSKSKKRHGQRCAKREAPADAPVAEPRPPLEPMDLNGADASLPPVSAVRAVFTRGSELAPPTRAATVASKPRSRLAADASQGARRPAAATLAVETGKVGHASGGAAATTMAERVREGALGALMRRRRLAPEAYVARTPIQWETRSCSSEASSARGDDDDGSGSISTSCSSSDDSDESSSTQRRPKSPANQRGGQSRQKEQQQQQQVTAKSGVPVLRRPEAATWVASLSSPSGSGSCIEFVRQGELSKQSYGKSPYKLYEAWGPKQRAQNPLLVLWLHGADMGEIAAKDLLSMQERFNRKVFFLVPMSPRGAASGLHFDWGICYKKEQNKHNLAFVFGNTHEPYLSDLCNLTTAIAKEIGAAHVCGLGYSMGGFGMYQLAGYRPETFDVVVSIAGYGRGTLEAPDAGFRAPQPESSERFRDFVGTCVPQWARLPRLLVVHAACDKVSSIKDSFYIADSVKKRGGSVEFVLVPDDVADSDNRGRKRKRAKSGHSYFGYTLLREEGEGLVFPRIRAGLDGVPSRCQVSAAVSSADGAGARPGWGRGSAAALVHQAAGSTTTSGPTVAAPLKEALPASKRQRLDLNRHFEVDPNDV